MHTNLKILKSKFLIFAAAGLAAYWLLTRKSIADKARLIFRKISFTGGLRRPKFVLDFVVDNPTNQTGTLKAVTGEIFVNEKLVADFSNFSEQRIAARSRNPLKIEARPSGSVLSLLTSKGLFQSGVNYEIKGTANFDGIVSPFTHFGKL